MLKNNKDDIIEIIFKNREKEIFISKDRQREVIGNSVIDFTDIISSINDENTINKLYAYEEQINLINAEYIKIFYKQRILRCNKVIKMKLINNTYNEIYIIKK